MTPEQFFPWLYMTRKEFIRLFDPGIPLCVLYTIAGLFILCFFYLLISVKNKRVIKLTSGLILILYVFFIISTTIIFRPEHQNRTYNLLPFWSYMAILSGERNVFFSIFLNILLFIPLGFYLGFFSKTISVGRIFIYGLTLSFIIEIMQFLLKRGFSEFDDVFHNSLGCLIGFGLYKIVCRIKLLNFSK